MFVFPCETIHPTEWSCQSKLWMFSLWELPSCFYSPHTQRHKILLVFNFSHFRHDNKNNIQNNNLHWSLPFYFSQWLCWETMAIMFSLYCIFSLLSVTSLHQPSFRRSTLQRSRWWLLACVIHNIWVPLRCSCYLYQYAFLHRLFWSLFLFVLILFFCLRKSNMLSILFIVPVRFWELELEFFGQPKVI